MIEDEPTLFDHVQPTAHARHDDPQTSHQAAVAARTPRARSIMTTLLRVFASRAQGLTADEVTIIASMELGSGVWKRCSDLKRQGWVEPNGLTRRGASGRAQDVLVITDAGRAVLADMAQRS